MEGHVKEVDVTESISGLT